MAIRNRRNNDKFFIDITFNRKRYRFVCPKNTLAAAKNYERVILGKLARGEEIKESEPEQEVNQIPTFKDFVPEWINSYVKSNNRPSEQWNKWSVLKVHLLPWFGDMTLDRITSRDIENFKAAKINANLSPKTVNNHLIVLSRILHIANEWEIIDKIPKIKKIKVVAKKIDFLTEDELESLLDNSEGHLKEMILLAARTGLRFGELIGLKWENINLAGDEPSLAVINSISRGIIGPPKSGKARYIPLVKEVERILRNRTQINGYVFADKDGKFLAHTTYLSQIKKACRKAGLRKIGWHTLRHTFASHLAMKGVPMVALKELMGHSSITTTMIYAHLSRSTLVESIRLLEKPENKILGTIWAPAILTGNEILSDNKKCL